MTDKLDRFIRQKQKENADKPQKPQKRLNQRSSPLRHLEKAILSPEGQPPPKDPKKAH